MTVKSEQEFEKDIQDLGLTKNRLTPEDIDATIDVVQYHIFKGTTLTVCCITLTNGFTVTGESACVDPDNFNILIGQEIAYNEARGKIWGFEGYLLNYKLHHGCNGVSNDVARDVMKSDPTAGDGVTGE